MTKFPDRKARNRCVEIKVKSRADHFNNEKVDPEKSVRARLFRSISMNNFMRSKGVNTH
jgi:hypothetical protein